MLTLALSDHFDTTLQNKQTVAAILINIMMIVIKCLQVTDNSSMSYGRRACFHAALTTLLTTRAPARRVLAPKNPPLCHK